MSYLTKKSLTAARSRLTRAKNSGDPQKVVDEVNRTLREWDDAGAYYPDSWYEWVRAADDAAEQLRRTSHRTLRSF